jgi:multidrug transporter EmrE-like cation transporter
MDLVILLVAVLVNACGNVLIKVGMNNAGALNLTEPFKAVISIFLNPSVLAGISCYIIALVGYSFTLSRMNLSVAYPVMSGLGFVVIQISSYYLLHEKIQPLQIIGCLTILSGVWMVALVQK